MAVQKTAGDDVVMRRKRARYRAWHRGTREMDLVLGGFADAHCEHWSAEDLSRFEAILDEGDIDLLAWITGQLSIPEDADTKLIAAIAQFQRDNAGL